jgi:hypothetical protein
MEVSNIRRCGSSSSWSYAHQKNGPTTDDVSMAPKGSLSVLTMDMYLSLGSEIVLGMKVSLCWASFWML